MTVPSDSTSHSRTVSMTTPGRRIVTVSAISKDGIPNVVLSPASRPPSGCRSMADWSQMPGTTESTNSRTNSDAPSSVQWVSPL